MVARVIKTKKLASNSTDLALLVESNTQNDIFEYDENKIKEALEREIDCPEHIAKEIASNVTDRINKAGMTTITTSLIRSFVNVALIEKGYEKQLKSNSSVTIPFYDIKQVIENANKENGNTTHNPESINLSIAGKIMKEYVLREILTPEIARNHLEGRIHVHDMDLFIRFYCSGHSVEYIKKFGLRGIPTIPCNSKPASNAWVLARHLCSITQFFSSQFAGAIGWEAVNMFFAPLITGWDYSDIKQLAQTLIFDLAQLAGARGGQISFTDFNVYLGVPEHYKETYAVGKKGKYMVRNIDGDVQYFDTQEDVNEFVKGDCTLQILKYKDFEKESMAFTEAMLEVVREGDADGMPFAFPKINLHVNEDSFVNTDKRDLLLKACKAASDNGCPYFLFDRNAFSVSQCCRLKIDFTEEDKKLVGTPEELRFVGIQNVSINLPNCALEANHSEEDFYTELERRMRLACDAHIIKRDYVWGLANMQNSPLSFYTKGIDGKPYIKLSNSSYLIGIVGLNECVYNLIGQQLHESEEAFLKGMEIISFMNLKTKELAEEYGISIKLEETPAESTAGRFAKLDVRKFGDKAYVKKNEEGIYYTNSIHYAADSDVDYITRLMEQSKFHNLVEAGSMIHIWGGENKPDPMAIFKLLELTWYKTDCVQWVLSPEYTVCRDCGTKVNGIIDECKKCGSGNVTSVTRITGYYVFINKFNAGKRAELHDRKREKIE